jgi:small GTP-binding protein
MDSVKIQNTLKNFTNLLKNGDSSSIAILISIFIGLLTLVLLVILRRRKNLHRRVLLVGLCDAGKTVLFSQLVHKKQANTYTSIKENVGSYHPANKKATLSIVDIPGHERLRLQFFVQFKTTARALIFVIDSATLQKEIKDVAEFLYTILCDNAIAQISPPVLIACNKQDNTFAKSKKVIQSQLEKEMNTLRITQSAQLYSTSDTGNNNTFLGKRNKDFEFSQLAPIKVDFVECTTAGDGDITGIHEWLERIA